jgi:integrase
MARHGDGIYQRGDTWWLDFTHRGERHAVRLGRGVTKTVARELASVQRAAILRGEAGIGTKVRKDCTFDEARAEFMTWATANKRPRTARTYGQCLAALATSFAGRRLSQISPFDIERHKRGRLEAGVRVMVNREVECLRALYNRYRAWSLYEGENPATKVSRVKESEGRLRYLDPDEERALLAAAREPLRTIILAGIYAGLRIETEALTLRPGDADLRTGLLTVHSAYAKSGKTRRVPMNAPLRAAIAHLKERGAGEEYLFVGRHGRPLRAIRTAFATACRHAKLVGVTPHVLRHTFASRLVMAGVNLRAVQELGGWSSLALVQRYAHLAPGHLSAAVEQIALERFDSPTVFTTAVRGCIVSPRAPVAQVDRAAVS